MVCICYINYCSSSICIWCCKFFLYSAEQGKISNHDVFSVGYGIKRVRAFCCNCTVSCNCCTVCSNRTHVQVFNFNQYARHWLSLLICYCSGYCSKCTGRDIRAAGLAANAHYKFCNKINVVSLFNKINNRGCVYFLIELYICIFIVSPGR